MKILQMLSMPISDVRKKIGFPMSTYNKKFYGQNPVKYQEWLNKIKPYVLKHIEELQEEVKFLDLYFMENNKLPGLGGGNYISVAGRSKKSHSEILESDKASAAAKIFCESTEAKDVEELIDIDVYQNNNSKVERFSGGDILIAYDNLRARFRKLFPDSISLTKAIVSVYLGIERSMLYNPASYKNIGFLKQIKSTLVNMEMYDLRDFLDLYKKGSYDQKERYKRFFSASNTSKQSPGGWVT